MQRAWRRRERVVAVRDQRHADLANLHGGRASGSMMRLANRDGGAAMPWTAASRKWQRER
jgi:hypothetical protein